MGGQYTRRPPRIVVVGSAARDIAPDDPRGWRLGGAVSYGALTVARLGIPTGAVIGVDALAARAAELDLLRQAGVDVVLVELDHGPIFDNREGPAGRVQHCLDSGDPVTTDHLPDGWRDAPGWLLAQVAGELPEAWAEQPPRDALVGVAWQGMLRNLGRPVTRRPPESSAIVRRADVIGVSVHDLDAGTQLAMLTGLIRLGATLLLTRGESGGLAVSVTSAGERAVRRYPAVSPEASDDPTGAGDVFLAAFLAALTEPGLGGQGGLCARLRIAATAASFAIERPGLLGVPDLAMIRRRTSQRRTDAARIPPAGALD
jgi:sugar/nucleoside kinase (ribokinase family)